MKSHRGSQTSSLKKEKKCVNLLSQLKEKRGRNKSRSWNLGTTPAHRRGETSCRVSSVSIDKKQRKKVSAVGRGA